MSELLSTHPHAWREVSKGLWNRPLAGMEPLFAFVGHLTASMFAGREHCVVYSAVQIQTPQPIEVNDLKEVWKRLRFQHPNLATTTNVADWTLNYKVPTEEDIAQWLSDTFIVVRQEKAVDIYPKLQPIKNATLYWLPDSNELIFRCPHAKIDGIGTFLFWDALFALLTQFQKSNTIPWGEEIADLPPSMEHILGYEVTPTTEQANQAQTIAREYFSKAPGISPASIQEGAPGECRKIALELDELETSAIVDASKACGISVTSAVHAAFALANVVHAALELKDRDYLTMGQFSLRKYFDCSKDFSRMLCLYYVMWPNVFPVLDFDKMGQTMHDYYHQTYPAALQITGHFLRVLDQIMQGPESQASPLSGGAIFSSLGVVEKYLKISYPESGLEIKNIDNTIDIVVGVPLVSMYTFRDRLHITYSYNNGAQSVEQARAMLDTTMDVLRRELSIT